MRKSILNAKRRPSTLPHTTFHIGPRYDEDELIDRILDLMSNEKWNEAKFVFSTCHFTDRQAIIDLLNENN